LAVFQPEGELHFAPTWRPINLPIETGRCGDDSISTNYRLIVESHDASMQPNQGGENFGKAQSQSPPKFEEFLISDHR
jgi:hypothetical protein